MATLIPMRGGRIGLIAGNGRFPIIFSDNARKLGHHVSAVAFEGETEPELERHVDRIHWVKIREVLAGMGWFPSLTILRLPLYEN